MQPNKSSAIVNPTVGRVVLLGRALNGQINLEPTQRPMAAGVAVVHDGLRITADIWNETTPAMRHRQFDHASNCKDWAMCWDWMPFQKGQAQKLEDVKRSAVDGIMGLLEPVTPAELDHRYTHHPPTPDQIKVYERIRRETKSLATTLVELLPPCPELARALDALDIVMMTANAGVARNTKGDTR